MSEGYFFYKEIFSCRYARADTYLYKHYCFLSYSFVDSDSKWREGKILRSNFIIHYDLERLLNRYEIHFADRDDSSFMNDVCIIYLRLKRHQQCIISLQCTFSAFLSPIQIESCFEKYRKFCAPKILNAFIIQNSSIIKVFL